MSPWIHVAGWTLVHFVWQGGLCALSTVATLRLLRPASANVRYGVCCAALAAMLAWPLVTARLLSASGPAAVERDRSRVVFFRDMSAPNRLAAPNPLQSITAATRGQIPLDTARVLVNRFLPLVVAMWLTGVALLLMRLAGGWWCLRRLHRVSLRASASRWHSQTERVASRLRLGRAVHVVDSWLVDTPTVIGWLRPVVLLPLAALANLTPAQVEAILAHELAHIRRHDYLVNLLQTVAETLLFYHPAVWWVSARIRAEREHCCDDVAVEVCGDAVSYVAALAEIETARTSPTGRAGHTALALAATGGSLLDRVRRVLRVHAEPEPPSSNGMMTAALVLLLIVAAVGLPRVPHVQASTGAPVDVDQVLPARSVIAMLDAPPARLLPFEPRNLEARFRVATPLGGAVTAVQSPSPTVSGTILDASGAAIPGVLVVLTDVRTNTDLTARGNQSGHFEFVRLLAGDYLLGVTLPGFEPFHGRLTLLMGQTLHQDVTLQIQPVAIVTTIGRFVNRVVDDVAAGGPGRGVPRPLPTGWTCLDNEPFGGLCGPPSLVEEFAQDRLEQRAARAQPAQPMGIRPPLYPQHLWDTRVEGSVVLEGRIRPDGTVTGLEVVAPVHPDFATLAIDTVSQWQFQPARLNGVAVESPLKVTMNFRLHL
jgi:TonB family protein